MKNLITSLFLLTIVIINLAVVIRHDVSDTEYRALASNYPAVGAISSDVEDFSCSCTLVAPDLVLTAAHCIDDSGDGIPDDPEDTMTSRVLFGANGNNPTHSVEVDAYYLLPQWHQSGSLNRIDGNDIALLKLKTPILDIAPMKISLSNPVGLVGTTVGYGATTNGNTTELGETDGFRRAGQNLIEYKTTLGTGIDDLGALHGDFDAPDGSTNTMNIFFEDLDVNQSSSATPLPLEGFGWGGDSGGPVCANFGDGAGNVIVGIASSSFNPINDDAPCGYGAIDVWASFTNPGVKDFLESYNLELHTEGINTSLTEKENLSFESNVFPNPFMDFCNFNFDLKKQSTISLKVFNIEGKLIDTIIDNRSYVSGKYTKQWTPKGLEPNILLYQFTIDNFKITEKLIAN